MSVDVDIDKKIKIDEKIKKEIREPSKYNIIFLNDDVTPMDWVIEILVSIYHYAPKSAEEITLKIHHEGSAIVGSYTFEIAEQKLIETTNMARNNGFPFIAKIEQES